MATASDIIQNKNCEYTLETQMESLDLNESLPPIEPIDSQKVYTLRKRIPKANSDDKRRVKIKPQKRLKTNSNDSSIDIKEIYLSKKIKRLAPNLETIFEEPKIGKTNEILYTEMRKKKRFIVFDPSNQKKIKKRQQKIKKLLGVARPDYKKKHFSTDVLLKKLRNIE